MSGHHAGGKTPDEGMKDLSLPHEIKMNGYTPMFKDWTSLPGGLVSST